MKINQSAAIYFTVQGIAVIAWWLLLFFMPDSRKYFQLEPTSEASLLAFWLADLMLLGAGSLLAAWLCLKNNENKSIVLWLVVGAISYAAFYCLAFAFFTDAGWLGVTLMFPAMIWSGNFAIGLSPVKNFMFRQAKQSSANWILLKTFTQILIVWSLILAVFPYFITLLEDKVGNCQIRFAISKNLRRIIFRFD